MTWVPGHSARMWHTWVRALGLLSLGLLEVCLVLKLLLLFWRHTIARWKRRGLGVAGLTRHGSLWQLGVVFRRFNSRSTTVAIDAIGFGSWFGRIETGLKSVRATCLAEQFEVLVDLMSLPGSDSCLQV